MCLSYFYTINEPFEIIIIGYDLFDRIDSNQLPTHMQQDNSVWY